jgi:hypothetical protein
MGPRMFPVALGIGTEAAHRGVGELHSCHSRAHSWSLYARHVHVSRATPDPPLAGASANEGRRFADSGSIQRPPRIGMPSQGPETGASPSRYRISEIRSRAARSNVVHLPRRGFLPARRGRGRAMSKSWLRTWIRTSLERRECPTTAYRRAG